MIIFDLDGTLAKCEHRRHFVVNPYMIDGQPPDCTCSDPDDYSCPFDDYAAWRPNWKFFFEACDKDTPIWPTIEIFKLLSHDNEVQIWSGRCESVRKKTIKWLLNHIHPYEEEETVNRILKMRPIGDYTPDDQLKEMWLDEFLKEGKKIEYVFDDRKKVVDMWRRRGIFVFDVSQGDGDF